MAVTKLNKTFESQQVLTAQEMNQITNKIDELVDGVNSNASSIPDVSTFITTSAADQKYQPKGEYLTSIPSEYVTDSELEGKGYLTEHQDISGLATKEELTSKADKITVVSVEGATPTQEIQPNKLYKFGECTSLTVTLAAEIPDIYNEYMFEFVSGATPTTLNLPETVKWIETPTVEANKTYQVSIVNNLAVIGGWSNE